MPKQTMQEFIDSLADANAQDVMELGTDRLPELLDRVIPIVEQYEAADQSLAFAYMLGCLIAQWEGMTCDHEQETRELIGHELRLKLFNAEVLAVFRDAYKAAQHPDCPKPQGRVQ